ncbi:MAG: methyltransferase [Acholeplasmatales bacterium]|jgi:16S rRNA (guanine1207-N2)-methyltransferase|nr:methyltransferase [Acholeplasmatales bacterium]
MQKQHYFIDSPLSSNLIEFKVVINGLEVLINSDEGIFSKNKLDAGTAIMLESINYPARKNILDLGCGYGIVGLYLAKRYPDSQVFLRDINVKAIELSKMNIQKNQLTNIQANFEDASLKIHASKKYDLIAFNPPIKAGKKTIFAIIKNTTFVLNKRTGKLVIVNLKSQGAPSTIKFLAELYQDVKVIKKKAGYFVIEASKPI